MNYLDNKRANTAEDLRRMFNLDGLSSDRKAIENNKKSLTKIDSEQNNILKSIIISIGDDLESQSDVSLWFFSGTPTLENVPYTDWEDKDEHLGDLYYDKATGFVYLFKKENNEYLWLRQEEHDLIQAMALTNSEIDTTDSVRKVFFTIPSVPYDNGDWYVKDGDLYICQISKSAEELYDENDFIIAPKYTDDTKANEVAGNLTIVSGQVTTIIQNLDIIQQTIEDDRYYVDEEGNRHLISQTVSQLTQEVDSLTGLIQITGGSNLIRNSQGLLDDDVWIEQAGGSYVKGYDSSLIGEVTSISKLGISNGKLTTTESNITGLVTGNKYTLSYKITNEEDTETTIRLIGVNTLYEKTYDEECVFYDETIDFIADSSTCILEIESTSEYDNWCFVYDLMLNAGDKKPWEPARDEIVGTVLKLSRMGLQIYSTGSEIATLMSSQGFQIRRFKNNELYEIITEFTDKGITTNQINYISDNMDGLIHKTISSGGYKKYISYVGGGN